MASRFKSVQFDDFGVKDIRKIWDRLLQKYNPTDDAGESLGWCVLDPGVSKVATHRIARGIGRKGFGNARDARTLFEQAVNRAQIRSSTAPSNDEDADQDLVALYERDPNLFRRTIVVEDIIGQSPKESTAVTTVMDELNGYVGLERVKRRFGEIVDVSRSE